VVAARAAAKAQARAQQSISGSTNHDKGSKRKGDHGTLAPAPASTGRSYPCAECGTVHLHRNMIVSKRPPHAKMREVAPENIKDLPKQEVIYLKIFAECELR